MDNRSTWSSRLGFVLASAGAAVGLGAIWKFPYLVGSNGGSAFLFPFIVLTFTIGLVLLIAELTIGRAGAGCIVTAFRNLGGKNWGKAGYLGVITGFLIKRVVLPGEVSAFVMEIPPYHIPTVKGVMMRTWDRLKAFLNRAGKVIVVICAVLGFLNSWGTDGSFGNEDSEKSVLSEIGYTIAPVLSPMGVTQENWPAAVGVFTGIFAKEAVVGTLNSLYDQMARDKNAEAAGEGAAAPAEEEADEGWSLGAILSEAGGTIVDNLADLGGAFTDPLGIAVDDLSDTAAAAESQEVTVTTIDMMQKLFGSQLAAFAYLMLVLLYMPCVAAIAAVYREAGAAWTLFLAAWTTVLGYSTATIVYRVGTFAQDPLYATVAIVISLGLLASLLFFMRNYVKNNRGKGPKVIPIAVAQPS